MKIVKIIGGLGNQMFQFALYEALRRRFPSERVLLDLHCFKGYHKHRGFELPAIFDVTYEEATWQDNARVAYPYPNYQCWRIGSHILPQRKTMLKEKADYAFEPTALTRPGDGYYDGYWQHEEYFEAIRNQLLETFRFSPIRDKQNLQVAQLVSSTKSCAVHVRRGDYVTDRLFRNICTKDYYEAAIIRIKELADPEVFCFFSDDIAWCRENLSAMTGKAQTVYIDWNVGADSFRDMQLMSLCSHQIIANSSFSWWGAWLNQNEDKCVIAPQKWWNLEHVYPPISTKWIRIS